MTNFSPKSNHPNLSLGQWIGNGSDKQFKTLRGNCGVTHKNKGGKTGNHTFYFNPKGDGWKETGFRAIVVVNTRTVHEFEIKA